MVAALDARAAECLEHAVFGGGDEGDFLEGLGVGCGRPTGMGHSQEPAE